MIRLFLSLCLSALCAGPVSAQYDPFSDGGGTQTVAAMVPEAKAFVPGKPLAFALELKHPEKWHSYYLNSGGIELSPEIKWELPPGFTAVPIQWPVPGVKDGYSAKSLVYEAQLQPHGFSLRRTTPRASTRHPRFCRSSHAIRSYDTA